MMDIVTALERVLDRLIALTQGRIDNRKATFAHTLEPVFNELLLVHGDYLKMFQSALLRLDDIAHSRHVDSGQAQQVFSQHLAAIQSDLQRNRLELEPLRAKTRALIMQLKATQLPEPEAEFVDSVIAYFPEAEPLPRRSGATTALEHLAYVDSEKEAREILTWAVQTRQEHWSDICVAYARLKLAIDRVR